MRSRKFIFRALDDRPRPFERTQAMLLVATLAGAGCSGVIGAGGAGQSTGSGSGGASVATTGSASSTGAASATGAGSGIGTVGPTGSGGTRRPPIPTPLARSRSIGSPPAST